ncbi:hypothetical protein VP01_1191g9 [Puccinia sorghi]|uniref:Uncharacterized protein n=1 Tax=Puccinia sorghi TaxID=27349 RepID=A0A0L6VR12_9BASI|nr:hypothetical protein VP01_1191g9 [Puccinia sorghi]
MGLSPTSQCKTPAHLLIRSSWFLPFPPQIITLPKSTLALCRNISAFTCTLLGLTIKLSKVWKLSPAPQEFQKGCSPTLNPDTSNPSHPR